MPDTYEQNLSSKASLTAYDFLRVVGSDNVSYKQDMRSSLQALMAAMPRLTSSDDLNNVLTPGIYYTADANLPANAPQADVYNSTIVVLNARTGSAPDVFQIYLCNNNEKQYFRSKFGTSWRPWVQLPTRAEMEAVSTRTNITSSVTVNSKLTVNVFHVYKTGKVVSVLGTFTATDSIPNGDALISGLPTSGIGGNDICPMLTPVRASCWSTTPSKYHFQSLRNTEILNGTTTLASGDVIQINLTYLAR